MATIRPAGRVWFFRSIIFKNVLLFLLILLVAVVPLALRYYQDSRDYEIQNLASKLEFFAERGASWIDVEPVTTLIHREQKQTPAYRNLLQTLQRIEKEFDVDNAVVMRRQPNGQYVFIAAGHDGFDIGQSAYIHTLFPATYKATDDTWQAGEMMHSQLFGGKVIHHDLLPPVKTLCRLLHGLDDTWPWQRVCSPPDTDQSFAQFIQINTPLKLDGRVVAILMLNKFADPVAAAVRAKTMWLVRLTVGIVAVGLLLFGYASARMLQPLKTLTASAGEVAQGNLETMLPPPRSRDEVGRLSATFAAMLDGLRQRDFIRDAFGRYLSKEVVEELLGSPDGLKMGGELREVTFLVSDLRGFTSTAAHMAPQEVIHILNQYLEPMVEIIGRHRGTIDEFQGDGILAFFGAPLSADDDPERAIACAIEMQTVLSHMNAAQRQQGLPELAMGIGISTGSVIVGNIGSEKRTKYGAVGSAINTAYRIESYTVGGQILIGPSTYERVRSLVQVRGTLEIQFKGLEAPITIYDVVGIQGGRYDRSLPQQPTEPFVSLHVPLSISCYVVEGKTVSDQAIAGRLTHLAASSARVCLDGEVPLHSNLKVTIETLDAAVHADLYAKVLEHLPQPEEDLSTYVCMGFTSMPEATKVFLERYRTMALHTTSSRVSAG